MSGAETLIQLEAEPTVQSQLDLVPAPATLRNALIESRQRWRQFGALATDMVFETDAAGRLSFLAPDQVLGWSAPDLLGLPARALLLDGDGQDVFASPTAIHRRPTWLRTRRQGEVCMALSITPMRDAEGSFRGTRGVAVDVTEQEKANIASAATLRRAEVLDHIMDRMRQEVLAPRMMQALLDGVMRSLGATGALVVDLSHVGGTPSSAWVLHMTGATVPSLFRALAAAVTETDDAIIRFELPDQSQVVACPCSTRFGERAALTAWRPPGARPWDADDLKLVGSVTGVTRMVLEHESIQRELARQARTDSLTGLLNRRAFVEEAARRLDRLEREQIAATVMYLDLDRLKELNDQLGHETGDAALKLVGALLIRVFRPQDLIARLGGDEFAVWLDGADSLTAAERAEELRITTPMELVHLTGGKILPPSVSIGIATRDASSTETLDQMLQRADQAMYKVKRAGRGAWHVSHAVDGTES